MSSLQSILKGTVGLIISLLTIMSTFAQPSDYYLYVGTYTRSKDQGIHVYQFNSNTGDFKEVSMLPGIANPSFLAIAPDQKFLYATSGIKEDSVTAFAIEIPSHHLRFLNARSLGPSSGACHLEVDKTGKWVIIGSYGSGSISVLSLEVGGLLGPLAQTIRLEGRSVHPQQDRSHVHSINIAPNNKDVFVPDLGTDKIMTFRFDDKSGKLTPGAVPFTEVTAGSGPRHFTFHPNGNYAYAIEELSATITAFAYQGGNLTEIQTISNLPDGYSGRKWDADIHISPDGKFLYGSNRAHESLGIFRIDSSTGKLTLVGHQTVLGKTPRNFVIDPTGNFLLVANQDTDNIVVFRRDRATGKLTATGKEIKVPQPVCLKLIP